MAPSFEDVYREKYLLLTGVFDKVHAAIEVQAVEPTDS